MRNFFTVGHRIILLYTAMTLCAIAMVAAVVWYWTSDYDDEICYSYLEERADLIARENLERYSGNRIYNAWMQHRREAASKPFATQIVLDADKTRSTDIALRRLLNDRQLLLLLNTGEVRFRHGESLGVVLYSPKQEGNFFVVVTLNMHVGDYLYQRMGYWLLGVAGLCVVMVILVSKVYTLRHIRSLGEAYQRERQFVHHASHELNNPLTAIQGECEITLMKPRSPEDYQDALGRIGSEAQRMSQIIRQLLYLSAAMNDGGGGDEKTLIPLAGFLKEVTAGESRVELRLEDDAAEAAVMANTWLLKMAFGNIVRNALKYSTSTVLVTLSAHRLTVADTGIGIPKADLAFIAQPFYRASNTRSFEGHGVGMSLAVNILRLYGIQIKIKSKENVGTTVELRWKKNAEV